jgi:hypothetical protein
LKKIKKSGAGLILSHPLILSWIYKPMECCIWLFILIMIQVRNRTFCSQNIYIYIPALLYIYITSSTVHLYHASSSLLFFFFQFFFNIEFTRNWAS